MKKLTVYLFALMLITAFVFTGCKKDNEEPFNPQKELSKYLVDQDMDLDVILGSFFTEAPDNTNLTSFLADYYIIDIREKADFDAGHIEGAVNSTLPTILEEAENAESKPIVVACYSGQTAAYAITLLRLSGYKNATFLKWGMSAWNTECANHSKGWNGKTKDLYQDYPDNWNKDAAPANVKYDSPTFPAGSSIDPAEILKSRVTAVINDGFKTVMPNDVLSNPESYFINNYFNPQDYAAFGHIKGAYRIQPMLLKDETMNFNDTRNDKEIVTYCYTGQTSAAITAFQRVLGYNAYSMVFGMNQLYHSNDAWVKNKWSESIPKNLPLIVN
jgi:rhodanese-related sulfurtransferase